MFVLALVLEPFMVETAKRKAWKSFASSKEEGLSPDDKRTRCNVSVSDSELSSEPDEVIHLLNMAEAVMPKLDLVLEKPVKVESKLEELESYAKSVDAKVTKSTFLNYLKRRRIKCLKK